jgi:secondary thiamine-phosphate synthase enzyme
VFHHVDFMVKTRGRRTYDITEQVQRAVAQAEIVSGLCTIFVHHTSASLIITENADPDVHRDLDAFLARLVTDGDAIFSHTAEGPDDMSAHVRSVLTQTSISIPVQSSRCDLGTWQGIYLWEHRLADHERRVSVTLVGA